MRRASFFYEVQTDLVLTWAEFLILEEASKTHYDLRCREVAECGFLRSLRTQVIFDLAAKDNDLCGDALHEAMEAVKPADDMECELRLRWRELDILCKIAESPTLVHRGRPDIHFKLTNLLVAMADEQRRVNEPADDNDA